MKRSTLLTISALAHAAAALGLGAIQVQQKRSPTPMELVDAKPPPPKPEKSEPPPPPPPPPKAAPRPRVNARPAAVAQVADALSRPSFGDVPDFGLALAGVAGEGIAVALPPPQPELATPAPVKTLAAAPARSKAQGTCDRITKPAPVSVPRPDYPLEARAAGIEGKVRIKLTVNELGEVVDATFVQRLGHGFDEAALNAALRARFEPARACGKATTATFTIAMRFSSG